ncbi:MAG: BMP family ABC transporter substrate-binding protein [Actinomycetota bacterium]|nr:BMP family ABC transporter substrate-binding protein [Actinomycetota bacterium]
MKRRLLVTMLAGSLLAAACGDDDKTTTTDTSGSGAPVKAAWIYVGPTNDGGWTTAHDNGRKAVETALGDQVITTYKENVPEGPEVAQVIDDLVKDGNQIIFATSFGFGDAMIAAAEKYPNVKFEHATGLPNDIPNFASYFGAGEQSLYLSGMAAGVATESNVIGFVAPFPIPEVVRHINAYALGAQSVNPEAVVKVVWINSWFDPAKERQAAESLIADGADVIASGGDSPAPGDAAKAAGVAWTGYDSDQSANYPEVWLTAAVYDWGPYYTKQVQGIIDGNWTKGDYYGSIADGFTDLAPFGERVDADTRAAIEAKKAEIIAGTFDIFAGPINDQSGAEKVAEGSSISFGEQMSIQWFVEGVEGEIPS